MAEQHARRNSRQARLAKKAIDGYKITDDEKLDDRSQYVDPEIEAYWVKKKADQQRSWDEEAKLRRKQGRTGP